MVITQAIQEERRGEHLSTTMSDSESGGMPPPSSDPPALCGHHHRVKDADTTDAAGPLTRLATMYTFGHGHSHDEMLQNLTGVVEPAARCGVRIRGERYLPETHEKDVWGYNLYFTYNRLVSLPPTSASTIANMVSDVCSMRSPRMPIHRPSRAITASVPYDRFGVPLFSVRWKHLVGLWYPPLS